MNPAKADVTAKESRADPQSFDLRWESFKLVSSGLMNSTAAQQKLAI